jgi:hypothetical protein
MDAGTKSSLPGEFPHDYENVDRFMAHTSLLEVHQTWCVLLAGEFQFEAGDAGCAKPSMADTTGKHHSTVCYGENTPFSATALRISPDTCFQKANCKELAPSRFIEVGQLEHYSVCSRKVNCGGRYIEHLDGNLQNNHIVNLCLVD